MGGQAVLEQGLGLFGSPEDVALLDEVVATAYEERRRPAKPNLVCQNGEQVYRPELPG